MTRIQTAIVFVSSLLVLPATLSAQCSSPTPPPPSDAIPSTPQPSQPTTPDSPTTPTTPTTPDGPGTPNTPPDRVPRTTRGGRRGVPNTYERRESSKRRLRIKWDYPTPVSEELLDFRSALAEIRGKDPRPLLVLRECHSCKGTDDAVLIKRSNNEKTKLMLRWFHCVKLSERVMEKDHPYHSLFGGKWPPHLFLISWDGSVKQDLTGGQSRAVFVTAMTQVLAHDYKKDPQVAVKKWHHLLDKFDTLDARKNLLEKQIDSAIESKGPRSRKVRSLRAKLDRVAYELRKVLVLEKKYSDLGLKRAGTNQLLEKLRDGK